MTGQPWRPPVYDVHPADQAIREATGRSQDAGADPLRDYWSSMEIDRDLMIEEGWPRPAAEHMALQHLRDLAADEAPAGREAGQ